MVLAERIRQQLRQGSSLRPRSIGPDRDVFSFGRACRRCDLVCAFQMTRYSLATVHGRGEAVLAGLAHLWSGRRLRTSARPLRAGIKTISREPWKGHFRHGAAFGSESVEKGQFLPPIANDTEPAPGSKHRYAFRYYQVTQDSTPIAEMHFLIRSPRYRLLMSIFPLAFTKSTSD
jgi:hypothetical protein